MYCTVNSASWSLHRLDRSFVHPIGELGSSDLAEAAFTELAADHDVLITISKFHFSALFLQQFVYLFSSLCLVLSCVSSRRLPGVVSSNFPVWSPVCSLLLPSPNL
jgi:hypothetical protein